MRPLSKSRACFDSTPDGQRAAAADLGEVLAILAGGAKPDPETVARLCCSIRSMQVWLVRQADHPDADLPRPGDLIAAVDAARVVA